MELSSSQIEEFEERGFLFFPELLKSHEVKLLTDHLEGLYSRTGPEVVREKKGDGIRLVYGTHEFCQPYGKTLGASQAFAARSAITSKRGLYSSKPIESKAWFQRGSLELAPGFRHMAQGRRNA